MKGTSNLQTAADLIFMEKKIPTGNGNKSSNKKKEDEKPKDEAKPGPAKSTKKVEAKKVEAKKAEQEKPEARFNLVRPSKQAVVPSPAVENIAALKPIPPTTEHFPSLGASGSKISSNFVPVKTVQNQTWNGKVVVQTPAQPAPQPSKGAPPPGFQTVAPPSKKPAPPPGFKAPAAAPMTYQEPSNFAARNQQLLSTIMGLIGGKSVEFDRFKLFSSRFRSGGLSPNEYHTECLNLIEKSTFEKFFPQLIALLPDISKQKVRFRIKYKVGLSISLFNSYLGNFTFSDLLG